MEKQTVKMSNGQRIMLARIAVAALACVALQFIPLDGWGKLAAYLAVYLLIGYDILAEAAGGIMKGRVFDENFLMSIATVGAFALAIYERSGHYLEAIAVMLFYQIGEFFQSYAVAKSRRNIAALMDIRPDYANLEQDGRLVRVSPEEVASGSTIVILPGEKVPIDGMVIGLTILPGDEIAANTTVVTISDTSVITVSANVDERNISYIKPGMPVDLDQWGTPGFGTVETVSLSSTVNNGVATYPITIAADNADGSLQVNSYVDYTITASENDNCLILPLQCVRTVTQEDGTSLSVVFVKGDRPDNAVDTPMMDEEIPSGFWAVPVEIGISDNFHVEIKSGVEEGDEVFTQMQTMEAYG